MSTETRKSRYTVLKVPAYPTPEQAQLMEKTFGCCRYLWNQMLSDVQEFYAATDIHYIPTPARYKKQAPFLKEMAGARGDEANTRPCPFSGKRLLIFQALTSGLWAAIIRW